MISILRNGEYLTPDYARKANELYDKYHLIEINSEISSDERKKAMNGWWTKHFDLLIKSGLNKKDLQKVIASGIVKRRDGIDYFFDFLRKRNIPMIIISSGGLGKDAILMFLEKEKKFSNNIHIISDSYEWDANGNAIAVKQPIIHLANKAEMVNRRFLFSETIKERKNVLLLGDSIDDVEMVKGFNCDNLIKIGFLNENQEEHLEEYKRNYDAVILGDGSFDYINEFLSGIK